MAHAIMFDTHQYVKRLKEAGVPEQQAEIQAETMLDFIENQVASKKDLAEMETRQDLNQNLRLAELKTELIKWMLGIILAHGTIVITIMKLFH